MKRFRVEEICKLIGVDDALVSDFVRREWIQPVSPPENEFDEEDLTRIRFILDLINKMDVNEESVPIILHLVDKIHRLHLELLSRSSE